MNHLIDMNDLNPRETEMLSYCENLGGQTMPIELVVLFRAASNIPDNSKILEIGSYRGRSSAAIGYSIKNTNKKLYCLDIWRNYNTQPDNPLKGDLKKDNLPKTDFQVIEDFMKNTDWLDENICHLRGRTVDFIELFADESFNMVFIDGAHDYNNVSIDIDFAMRILKPKGIICGHDYHSAGTDVIKSVDEKIINNPDIKIKGIIPDTSIWMGIKD